jgi:hypothetical protein
MGRKDEEGSEEGAWKKRKGREGREGGDGVFFFRGGGGACMPMHGRGGVKSEEVERTGYLSPSVYLSGIGECCGSILRAADVDHAKLS